MNTKLHMVRVWLCPNRINSTHAQPPRFYTPAQLLAGGHWRREGRVAA